MFDLKFINVLGFKVFSDDLNLIPIDVKTFVVNTISPNSHGIAVKYEAFNKALMETDYLVLDGVYFAFASLLLKGKNIKRNQGFDMYYHYRQGIKSSLKKILELERNING